LQRFSPFQNNEFAGREEDLSESADKQTVQLSAITLNGLNRAEERVEQAVGRLGRMTDAPTSGEPTDVVDLSTATVGLLAARQDYSAQLQVLRTADKLERQALDLLA